MDVGNVGAVPRDPEEVLQRSPFHILVVEDDPVHFLLVQHLLESIFKDRLFLHWNKTVDTAIDSLRTGHYDVCLLDYLIQDGNAKMILDSVNVGLLNTAIIVVSAFEERSFILDALRAGADDYVLKGRFTAPELEKAIQFATYRKHKESVLRRRALYDPLTGLANRDLIYDRLDEARKYARRQNSRFAIAVLDIDRLKEINDNFGHAAGDTLIQATSQSIVASLRESDIVGRIGGDEFVAVLKDINAPGDLEKICSSICRSVSREPLIFSEGTVTPSCSIGVAVFPDKSQDIPLLFDLADKAMYQVKRQGGGGFQVA